jgi:exodeoxyribonuclease VII small subunit
MPNKPLDYRALSDELETIMLALQQDDIDVDVAMQRYERGLELIKQLEAYLKTAENKIVKLNAKG